MDATLPFPSLVLRFAANPMRGLATARALLKGWWYKLYLPLRGVRFRAGRNFRVFGSLSVRGPGRVVFGRDVVLYGRVTPWTHSRNAVITVGKGTHMDGVRIGCIQRVRIGSGCLFADCRILDTDFHSTQADRRSPDAPVRVAPVTIEDNAWIAGATALLPGTRIGLNSVVSFGSVCMREYPADVVIMGNPARVASPLPAQTDVGIPAPRAEKPAASRKPLVVR